MTDQTNLTASGRRLASLQAALMEAKTTDAAQAIAQLTSQVALLQQQVQQLQSTLFGASGQARLQALATVDANGVVTYATTKDPNYSAAKQAYTMLPAQMPAPGEWFDLVLTFDSSKTEATKSAAAAASDTSWNVDVFFGSASGSSSASSSSSASQMSATNTSFSIGFRAMKVTIDRGGWFDPTLFKASGELYHLGADTDDQENAYVPISYGASTVPGDQAGAKTEFAHLQTGILPTYPTAFMVVKDVTINLAFTGSDAANQAEAAQSASSDSGGIFCFSVSSSSSSSNSSSTATSAAIAENTIIKIPGPQILGWFSEYVAADESTKYKEMPSGFIPTTPSELTDGDDAGTNVLALPAGLPSLLAPAAPGGALAPAAVGTDGSAAAGAAHPGAIADEVDDLLSRPAPPAGMVASGAELVAAGAPSGPAPANGVTPAGAR
jgi:hypothetical protein